MRMLRVGGSIWVKPCEVVLVQGSRRSRHGAKRRAEAANCFYEAAPDDEPEPQPGPQLDSPRGRNPFRRR